MFNLVQMSLHLNLYFLINFFLYFEVFIMYITFLIFLNSINFLHFPIPSILMANLEQISYYTAIFHLQTKKSSVLQPTWVIWVLLPTKSDIWRGALIQIIFLIACLPREGWWKTGVWFHYKYWICICMSNQ